MSLKLTMVVWDEREVTRTTDAKVQYLPKRTSFFFFSFFSSSSSSSKNTGSSPWLVDPNCANKLSTQFKAPYTSSGCKIFGVISKPLTLAGNSAFWGAVWNPVHIFSKGGQKLYGFCMLPGYGSPNWHVSNSALIPMQLSLKPAN
jgi:hypothetical protein